MWSIHLCQFEVIFKVIGVWINDENRFYFIVSFLVVEHCLLIRDSRMWVFLKKN